MEMRHLATRESRIPKYQLRLKADIGRKYAQHLYSFRKDECRWSSEATTEMHRHCPYKLESSPGHFLSQVGIDLSERMVPRLDGVISDWR